MPIYPIPGNVVTGGTIQASDVTTLYNAINGGLDSQNIAVGGILTTNIGSAAVAAANVKQSTATLSVQQASTKHFGGAYLTVTSGALSFWPSLLTDGGAATHASIGGNVVNDTDADFTLATPKGIENTVSGVANATVWLAVLNTVNVGTNQASCNFQFIAASPPYDLGDGEVPLFIFALIDSTGQPRVVTVSHDPPWHGHHHQPKLILPHPLADAQADPAKHSEVMQALENHGQNIALMAKLRDKIPLAADPERKKALVTEMADIAGRTWDMTLETIADKNKHMAEIPHPFIANDPADWSGHGDGPWHVVMLDPLHPDISKMVAMHDSGENLNALVHSGYIKIGAKIDARKGPPGVHVVDHGFKNTK